MNELTLKQLCESCGVSRRAVQGYEKYGLVCAVDRTDRGYLLYSAETCEQVSRIKDMQNFGFTVKEIVDFYNLTAQQRVELLRRRSAALVSERDNIDAYISQIEKLIEETTEEHVSQ